MSQPSQRSTPTATTWGTRLVVGLTLVFALGACGGHSKVDVPDGSGVADANPVKKKPKSSDATAKKSSGANDDGSGDATTSSGADRASGTNGVADATADNATPVSSTSTDPSATAAPATTASNGNDTTTTATPAPTTAPTTTTTADPVKAYLVCWMGRVMQRASSATEIASYYAAVQAGEERRQQVAKMFGSDAYFARWSSAAKPWQAFANHAYLDIMGVSAPAAWTSSTLSTLAKEANVSGRTKVARMLLDKKWPVASGVPPCS